MCARGWRLGLLALVLGLVSTSLGGCTSGGEMEDAAHRLDHELGTPPWAVSVDVGSTRSGQGYEYVATVVDLEPAATPDQVADFVLALPTAADKAGLPGGFKYRQLTLLRPDGARMSIGWQPQVVRDEVRRGIAEWFAVADAFDGAVASTLLTGGGASFKINLGPVQRPAIAAAYRTLAPIAETDTQWEVSGSAGGESLDLSAATFPTPQQVGLWTTMLDRASTLPAPFAPASVTVQLQGDRVVADLGMLAPDDLTSHRLTVAAYGDRLWPVFRPQLAAVAASTQPWSYSVEFAPRSSPTTQTALISLLSDQAVANNGDESGRWSKAAAAYVHSL